MKRKALIAMWVALVLLVVTWIFPPILESNMINHYPWTRYDVPSWGFSLGSKTLRIDQQRLLLCDGLILLIGLGIIATIRRSK